MQAWSKISKMPAPAIRKIQNEQLTKMLGEELAVRHPYYRELFKEKNINPADIKGVEDLDKLPFTEKKDIVAPGDNPEHPKKFVLDVPTEDELKQKKKGFSLFGKKETGSDPSEFKFHTLYFTAGRTAKPVPIEYTYYDLNNLKEAGARAFDILDLTRDDTLINAFSIENNNSDNSASQPAADIPKTDKPNVELFVMSHCPYGTQIEKGILPVIDLLGDKIDFELKFCDYAMHGQEELNEQLNQYCIQKEQNNKLQPYLQCFLESSEGDACLEQVGINRSQLENCVTQADQEYKVTANFENKQGWKGNYPPFNVYQQDNAQYGVQGSPTLVVNGVKASSARDAQSLLNTICSGFKTAPEECSQQLDATPPAPGFGFEGSGSANASAGCTN